MGTSKPSIWASSLASAANAGYLLVEVQDIVKSQIHLASVFSTPNGLGLQHGTRSSTSYAGGPTRPSF